MFERALGIDHGSIERALRDLVNRYQLLFVGGGSSAGESDGIWVLYLAKLRVVSKSYSGRSF